MRASWLIRSPLGEYRLRVVQGFAAANEVPSEDLWFFASQEVEELRPDAVWGALELYRALTGKRVYLTGTPDDAWQLAIVSHELESALRNGRLAFEHIEPPLVRARTFRPAELPEAQELVGEVEEVSMSIASNFDDEWPEMELEDECDEWPDLDLAADAEDSDQELIEIYAQADGEEDAAADAEEPRASTIGEESEGERAMPA
jgi:hypothetical protein